MIKTIPCGRCGGDVWNDAWVFADEIDVTGVATPIYHRNCYFIEYYARVWRVFKQTLGNLLPWRFL